MQVSVFERVFASKSNKILENTIIASQRRWEEFNASGSASGMLTEEARMQAAVNVLDARGFYAGKVQYPSVVVSAHLSDADKKTVVVVALVFVALVLIG